VGVPRKRRPQDQLEPAIRALEELLNVSITVVDRDGVFHSPQGLSLLDYDRQSHRKNPVCAHGFTPEQCVQHCRYEINAQGEEEGVPFVHTCWKGAMEVVVPLIHNGTHFGSLFAGIWRRPGSNRSPAGKAIQEAGQEAYRALPEFDPEEAERIGTMLAVFAQGMLSRLDDAVILDAQPESRKAEIRRYIRYNASRRIALSDLSEVLHLSPSRTSHAVRELFGRSFRELLRDERIQRAKYLLQSTDYPVGQVARQVGMPDEYHFNRTFKACVGVPPGRFRKETSTQPYH
jgi:AraC-like DNA-binding protein